MVCEPCSGRKTDDFFLSFFFFLNSIRHVVSCLCLTSLAVRLSQLVPSGPVATLMAVLHAIRSGHSVCTRCLAHVTVFQCLLSERGLEVLPFPSTTFPPPHTHTHRFYLEAIQPEHWATGFLEEIQGFVLDFCFLKDFHITQVGFKSFT